MQTTIGSIKPIFIPLKRQYFEAFKSGNKRIEYRRVGGRFTQANCSPGREVTLSLGYGSRNRIKGTVIRSWVEHHEHPTGPIADCYGTKPIDILAIEILIERDSFEFEQTALSEVQPPQPLVVTVRKETATTTVKTSSKITRPAARWYGGKWILGKWIVDYLPPHKIYVEPFSGMWSVGLRKQPSSVEIYNDLHPGAVNFWLQLRDNPKDLIPLIESTYFDKCLSEWFKEPGGTPLEQALKFYAECLLSYTGGGTTWPGHSTARLQHPECNRHSHLWAIADRIKNIQIFNSNALDIIEKFDGPDTLFYCDPCYLPETRASPRRYLYDMSSAQHQHLATLLNQVQGKVILSGYPSPTYSEYYSGWQQEVKKTASNTSHKKVLECLWIKPKDESMSATQTAITLFSGFGLADVGLEQAGFQVVGAV